MKNEQILEITEKLYKQEIDPNEAERLLLDLFAIGTLASKDEVVCKGFTLVRSQFNANFTREEASIYLQEKLFGLPSALQHTIFEAVYRLEYGGHDVQKVLNWYHKIEEIWKSQ